MKDVTCSSYLTSLYSCPSFAEQNPRLAMVCRRLAVPSQPGQLTRVGYRCIPYHKGHIQYKGGKLLRRETFCSSCSWKGFLTILLPRTLFPFTVTAVHSLGWVQLCVLHISLVLDLLFHYISFHFSSQVSSPFPSPLSLLGKNHQVIE